ncbi:MAG: BatA domain-containing protein [Gemmatales bacterium]|nr:BatA domain-containing protein [Gemmatales bacterium]MDW8386638.1 BatA domain-containing protein [Gemmatales bacterium]
MAFLAPLMLLGGSAVAIPIILHLLYRSRFRRVPWAAMEFLRKSIEQTRRRLKFQEWLLLALRIALLVLLALAFARPVSRSTAQSGSSANDAVDAVFVFDTSYSMDAADGPTTRLERARQAALVVLDHLPRDSTVQIVASADRAVLLGPKSPSNLSQARQIIAELRTTSLSTDHLPGLLEAEEALRTGQAANKELYLFSDMQALGFEKQQSAVAEKLRSLSRWATVYLVRCGSRPLRNATVAAIQPQSGIPHAGERLGLAVVVRNTSREPMANVSVALDAAGQTDSQVVPQLAPGETRVVSLTARFDKPGLHPLRVRLSPDDLPADNVLDQVLLVRDQVRVLVVDGRPNEREPEKSSSFFLMHSLRPVPETAWARYPIQPRMVTPRQAAPAMLADKDLCILANVRLASSASDPDALAPEFVDRLADFVRSGKGLLVFLGDQVNPVMYNQSMAQKHPLLPGRLGDVVRLPNNDPVRLDPSTCDPHGYLAGFREEPLNRIGQVEVDQYFGLDRLDEAAAVVLRYSDGRPAVIRQRFGQGAVVLVTTSPDPSWTIWPILPTFLPFVHVTLGHLLQEQTQAHNYVAGETLRWYPLARQAGNAFTLIRPDGSRTAVNAEVVSGRPVVTLQETHDAGLYQIVPTAEEDTLQEQPPTSPSDQQTPTASGQATTSSSGQHPPTASGQRKLPCTQPKLPGTLPQAIPFAVIPDLRESENLESLSDAELDARLGFSPIHLTAGDDMTAFSGSQRLHWEWTRWLLAVVVLVALAEVLVAWLSGRAW